MHVTFHLNYHIFVTFLSNFEFRLRVSQFFLYSIFENFSVTNYLSGFSSRKIEETMNHHILSESFCFIHKLSSEIQLAASLEIRISLENRIEVFVLSFLKYYS